MIDISQIILITVLNINCVNILTKTQSLSDSIKKQDPNIYCLLTGITFGKYSMGYDERAEKDIPQKC